MAEIFSYVKPLSNLEGIASSDGSFKLYSEQLSSINFDGTATKKQIKTKVSDLKTGQTLLVSDASYASNALFITKINIVNEEVEGVLTDKYYIYYLSEFSMEQPFDYQADYGNSFNGNTELYILKDDVDNFVLGNNGWSLTNNGNAIFSNVFARGTIEATSGKIDGNLIVGKTNLGTPLLTLGSNVFEGRPFENQSASHNGLIFDTNNYLLSYQTTQNVDITSVVAENVSESLYLHTATFTLPLVSGETNPLQVGDYVKLSGFTDSKLTFLNDTHQVTATDSTTFTVSIKYAVDLSNPITINVLATSFAMPRTYNIVSMTTANISQSVDASTVKIYSDDAAFFIVGSEVTLASFTGDLLSLNGSYVVTDLQTGYFSIKTPRVTAGTYTTSLGSIVLYEKKQKFKVGDSFNYMSFSSETGALKVTGTINAHSGNFTDHVYVGEAATTFYIDNKQLTDNFATLRTTEAHSFAIGDSVTVINVDSTFNGTYTITATPTSTTFKYAKTATNVSSTAVSPFGSVSSDSSKDGIIKVGVADTGITIEGTGDPETSAIYAGAGNYGNADTGFWMDATGRFSLKDKLTFDSSGNLTVSGTVNASAGNFTSTVTIGQSSTQGKLQVGTGTSYFEIVGTNAANTTAIKTNGAAYNISGVWLSADGRFSLGNNQLYIGTDGILHAPGIVTNSILIDSNNYWNTTGHLGQIRVGDTDNYLYWDGTVLAVNGSDITAPVIIMDAGTLKTSTTVGDGTSASQGAIIDYTSARFYPPNSSSPKTTISNSTGVITATDVDLTGIIKATSGYIGGINNGWHITTGHISSTGSTKKLELDAGIQDNKSKIFIGEGIWNSVNTPFYADSEGFFAVGNGISSLTFDPTANDNKGTVTITGVVQANSGYIGGQEKGWQIQNNGLLLTGEGNSRLGLASSSSTFTGGTATLNINDIIVDDEYQDYEEYFGTIYVSIDKNLLPSYYNTTGTPFDLIGSVMQMKFSTTDYMNAYFNNKSLFVQDVIEDTQAFFSEIIDNADDPAYPVISSPIAQTEIFPTIIEKTTTSAYLYCDELFSESAPATTTISGTSGLYTITVGSAAGLRIGMVLTGTGIVAGGTTVTNISGTTVTLDKANVGAVSGTGTFRKITGKNGLYYGTSVCTAGAIGATTLTMASTANIAIGMSVTGTGIPAATYVTDVLPIASGVSNITISKAVATTAATNATLTFASRIYIEGQTGITDGFYALSAAPTTSDFDEGVIFYGELDGYNTRHGKITIAYTGSALPKTVTDEGAMFSKKFYNSTTPTNPLTDYITITFYPEDAGINVHDAPQNVLEGYYFYNSSAATLSFYTEHVAETGGYFYMWAGKEDAKTANFSIKKIVTDEVTNEGKVVIKADAGTTPVGSIMMWATNTAPSGWIICDGRTVNSSVYPDLVIALGGTTSIAIPDMRGKFPLGAGGTTGGLGGAIASNPGLSGGATRYTYTSAASHSHNMNAFNIGAFSASTSITEGTAVANSDAHTHSVTGNSTASTARFFFSLTGNAWAYGSDDGHVHADGNYIANSGGYTSANTNSGHNHNMNAFTASTSITEGAITEGTAVGQTASTATIDITPPYYSVNFIIYTGVV